MSTKNISRTIIEGGRHTRNQEDRWLSNQSHRANNRQFSRNAKSLVDADELGATPQRRKVRKDFSDKLAPAYRWMRSQVGRPWAKVLSTLTSRFDTRTVAGRHIIYDHLLQDVCMNLSDRKLFESWRYFDFYVDEKGILQLSPENRWSPGRGRSYRLQNKDVPSRKEIFDWANGRKVMDFGVSLFWYKPKEKAWTQCSDGYYDKCYNKHRPAVKLSPIRPESVEIWKRRDTVREVQNKDGTVSYYLEIKIKECLQGVGNYFQEKRFSEEDIEMWNRMTEGQRDNLLWRKRY